MTDAPTTEVLLPPFEVTAGAREQLGVLGGAVRVDVETGGCCGTTWVFELADPEAPRAGDTRYGCPGAWLDVSDEAGLWLPGAVLDWSGRLRPPRFRVLNPGSEHVCPCRRSFGSPWPGPRQPTCRAYVPMPGDDTYEPPLRWQRQTGWQRN